jgi:hypothetical protein
MGLGQYGVETLMVALLMVKFTGKSNAIEKEDYVIITVLDMVLVRRITTVTASLALMDTQSGQALIAH